MNYGPWVMTRGINDAIAHSSSFSKEIVSAISRYKSQDWGDSSDDGKMLNDTAVKDGKDRIVALYKTSKGKVFIITEWDRSSTTILFASEY